jgi:hypothetical protein
MKKPALFFALLLASPLLATGYAQVMPGVDVGKAAPPLRALDQFGKEQTLASLMSAKGLVLLFFRSSDW